MQGDERSRDPKCINYTEIEAKDTMEQKSLYQQFQHKPRRFQATSASKNSCLIYEYVLKHGQMA